MAHKVNSPPIPIHVPTMFSNSPPSSSSSPPTQSPIPFPSPSQRSPSATAAAAPPPPTSPQPVVVSPCAACKVLRRRCVEKCVLAPYFPPTDPLKFTIAHRVFGASNIIKFLQELPESQRADAVSSMVYEANARIRDPVYGCAGAICQLQKQVSELQAQLAKAQAEMVNMQCQHANLLALICMEMTQTQSPEQQQNIIQPQTHVDMSCFLEDNNFGSAWEPLWT
uniref:LOB domain-containing protein n=1 Tax=Lotus japonicus TaxID=34305 RepID=I3T451_LOTJA|nr:unknown [Lotus japonicus]